MVRIPEKSKPSETPNVTGVSFDPTVGVDQKALSQFMKKADSDVRPPKRSRQRREISSIRLSNVMKRTIQEEADLHGMDFSDKAREILAAGLRSLGIKMRTDEF